MTARPDEITKLLARHNACPEGIPWASRFATWEELWQGCEAPDWMLWGLDAFGYKNSRRLRLFAAACALRVKPLWDDPEATNAIDVATNVATGGLAAADLPAAYAKTMKAQAATLGRADWSEAMAAAASACVATLRDVAMDAAMDASRESARAVYWDVTVAGSWREEGVWQAGELRRIVGGDIHGLIAEVRKKASGVLSVVA